MTENKIGIFITQYLLFLYMLFVPDWKNTCFIYQVENARINLYIKHKMKQCGVKNTINSIEEVFERKEKYNDKEKYIVYGQDHATIAPYFFGYRFICIEDGTANYLAQPVVFTKGLENEPVFPYGISRYIQKIYLTGRLEIKNEEVKKKAVLFDIKECWDRKTQDEKLEIMWIFGFDYNKFMEIVRKGRNVILLTQDFYPRYLTEQAQIHIYQELLKDIDLRSVVIKPHPEDKICYEKYFPGCMVIRDNFPFELLYLTEVPFRRVITVNSTSAYGLEKWDGVEIETHEEVLHNTYAGT